jgi:hypothetical protein
MIGQGKGFASAFFGTMPPARVPTLIPKGYH